MYNIQISLLVSKMNQTIDDRMKKYERDLEIRIPPDHSFIIRLDGHSFSKFTNGFKKPFDVMFVGAMIRTMNDLMVHFHAQTGYCHSDEITLIFNQVCTTTELFDKNKTVHQFNGRVQKLVSLAASYCSTRFNYHLNKLLLLREPHYSNQTLQKIKECTAYFDARILSFSEENKYEVLNHQIWRSVKDCHKNAISTYAQSYFSHKQLIGKNSDEKIEMLKTKQLDWNIDVPLYLKHGVYAKMNEYMKLTETSDEPIMSIRKQIVNRSFKIFNSPENIAMLFNTVWPKEMTVEYENIVVHDDGTLQILQKN